LDRTGLTAESKMQAVEGRVMLRVLVRADGTAGAVEIASSSGSAILDEAAVHAASTCHFIPATRDGLPIDAWAMVPVQFVVP
jgi:protein TonB